MSLQQLTLPIALNEDITFDTYYCGPNQTAVDYCKKLYQQDSEQFTYLWGECSVGRTHLLQAAVHHAGAKGARALYLPMTNARDWQTNVFEDLEQLDLVALDDIDAVLGDPAWEEALFHFYNRTLAGRCHWLIAASNPPMHLPAQLADLKSRLSASLVFQLANLADDEKISAMQLRASLRGFELPNDVGHYLLKILPRDTGHLFAFLDKLDDASLAMQRKLTIPFVKSVLAMKEQS